MAVPGNQSEKVKIRCLRIAPLIVVLLAFLCITSTCDARAADNQVLLFNDKCSGCHTIGGGDLAGPDLSHTAKWTESDLTQAVKRMEQNVGSLSDDEVSELVKFLKNEKAAALLKQSETQIAADSNPSGEPDAAGKGSSGPDDNMIDPGPNTAMSGKSQGQSKSVVASAERGEALFQGRAAFQNGGMSCIACHQAGGSGGLLGPDLSRVASKMSETALASACEKTAFKVMRPAYKDHPVTRQEARDLARYFVKLNEIKSTKREAPVGLIACSAAGGIIALIAIGYRNRNTSVRKRLKGR